MTVWLFIKKWWRWILIGVAMCAGFFFGLSLKKPKPLPPASGKKQIDAEQKTAVEEKRLEDEAKQKVEEELRLHEAVVETLTVEQKKKYEEIKDDPQAVNSFLVDIGKQIRGG